MTYSAPITGIEMARFIKAELGFSSTAGASLSVASRSEGPPSSHNYKPPFCSSEGMWPCSRAQVSIFTNKYTSILQTPLA
jgi:hypothetical protein